MATKKTARAKPVVTPRGTFVYPYLVEPDTEYNDAGVYRVKLRLPAGAKSTQALIDQIDAAAAEALAEALEAAETPKARKAVKACEDLPYQIETDDDDNETGFVLFSAKSLASWINPETKEVKTRHVAIFDAVGTPMDLDDLKIGNGTEGKLSLAFNKFYTAKLGAGVSTRLLGVQILKLVEWGPSATGLGFSDESDGEDLQSDGDEEAPAPRAQRKTKAKAAVVEEDEDEEEDAGDDF